MAYSTSVTAATLLGGVGLLHTSVQLENYGLFAGGLVLCMGGVLSSVSDVELTRPRFLKGNRAKPPTKGKKSKNSATPARPTYDGRESISLAPPPGDHHYVAALKGGYTMQSRTTKEPATGAARPTPPGTPASIALATPTTAPMATTTTTPITTPTTTSAPSPKTTPTQSPTPTSHAVPKSYPYARTAKPSPTPFTALPWTGPLPDTSSRPRITRYNVRSMQIANVMLAATTTKKPSSKHTARAPKPRTTKRLHQASFGSKTPGMTWKVTPLRRTDVKATPLTHGVKRTPTPMSGQFLSMSMRISAEAGTPTRVRAQPRQFVTGPEISIPIAAPREASKHTWSPTTNSPATRAYEATPAPVSAQPQTVRRHPAAYGSNYGRTPTNGAAPGKYGVLTTRPRGTGMQGHHASKTGPVGTVHRSGGF